MSNVRPALLVFAGSLLFLTGCGKGDVSKQIAAAGGSGILRVGFGVSPTTLDPAKVQDIETTGLLDNVFEGLVTWDEQNHLVPCLSDKWDVKDGGKTYVFHLRKGVKFHNGDPLTPEDVVFSFKRAADPTMSSPTAANYLDDIEGFGTDKLAVTVKDPDTVEIKIKAARPYFLGKLTYPCAMAVSKKAVGDGKEIKDLTQMVGTGPFKGGKYTPDVDLSLDGFEQYWRITSGRGDSKRNTRHQSEYRTCESADAKSKARRGLPSHEPARLCTVCRPASATGSGNGDRSEANCG